MGAFIVNLHVRVTDYDELLSQLRQMRLAHCYATPPRHGWASVYEERASTQDEAWIAQFAGDLSRRTQSPCIAFLVHDSDFLCYWLFDRGKLADEFNSCPDYFDGGGADDSEGALGGQPEVLRRYCRPNVQLEEIKETLAREPGFAEEQLEEVARLLGIDQERSLTNYNDLGREISPDEIDAQFVGTDEPELDEPPTHLKFPRLRSDSDEDDDADKPRGAAGLLKGALGSLFGGLGKSASKQDPLVAQFVEAAANGDLATIERLAAEGVDVNASGPVKIDWPGQSAQMAEMFARMAPTFPAPALFAAVAHKQLDAARRLIELGADVSFLHPLFGSAVHTAATAGSSDLLRLLLDSGADVNALNAQRQTPLAALRAIQQIIGQWRNLQSLGLGLGSAGLTAADVQRALPTEGWTECERLLVQAGGR